jgi:hypothetical protein
MAKGVVYEVQSHPHCGLALHADMKIAGKAGQGPCETFISDRGRYDH